MGQRHQIYIRIHNPLKNAEVVEDLKSFDSKHKQIKHAKAIFGEGDYSVLAFHHQWLYGMTAAAVCANIMKEVHNSESECHPLNKNYGTLPYPANMSSDNNYDKVDGYIQLLQSLLFNQFNTKFTEQGARFGIERTCFLNNELYDRETEVRETGRYDYCKNFTVGDNNDGVTIIDVVNKKYCFVNIGGDSTVEKLPRLVPSSVIDYVRAYYPTERKKLGAYCIKEECHNDKAKIAEKLSEHRGTIIFLKEEFKNFALLSLDEVKEMFPEVYK